MKEMKVKVPEALLVRLHSLKILHGRPIGETVTEALTAYFEGQAPRAEDRGD